MSIIAEARSSDSAYVETITRGWTTGAGSTIRPAEISWHMVMARVNGTVQLMVVGPWTTAGVASWGDGAELLWIKFRPGTYMPHLPTRKFLNSETTLPEASGKSFWLNGSAWQFPNFENVDTFLERLARREVLVHDPVVNAALQEDRPLTIPSRTIRHRFLHTTGLTQTHIRQVERARHAKALLEQGWSILDTVHEAGYFDQPHLTRSLRQWVGYTPAQIIRMSSPACHSVQDIMLASEYHTNVLENIR